MKNEERIQDEIEKTLQAFDDMPKLAVNPFLFTRIQVALASQLHGRNRQLLTTIRLKPIALALIILLNIITAVHVFEAGSSGDSREQLISTLSKDFNSSQNDF
ncbi:MAG: hypothetical protein NTV54_03710 [Ignavibacteriales bacterium]|nr:hypothetical protein [Ignavibacteriales bacterium]